MPGCQGPAPRNSLPSPPGASPLQYYTAWRFKRQFVYDERWYAAMRTRGAKLVRRYVSALPAVDAAVEQQWQTMFGNHNGPVLGLHMRGTDVMDNDEVYNVRRRVQSSEYLPLVQAYLVVHPTAMIFLATDDTKFLQNALAWPCADRIRVVSAVHRPVEGFRSNCRKRHAGAARDVLVDIYLLSRCDFLIAAVHAERSDPAPPSS